jgi:hypothetical protein
LADQAKEMAVIGCKFLSSGGQKEVGRWADGLLLHVFVDLSK